MAQARIDARARLLEMVGMDPEVYANRYQELSGGQQQRIGVLRALAAGRIAPHGWALRRPGPGDARKPRDELRSCRRG